MVFTFLIVAASSLILHEVGHWRALVRLGYRPTAAQFGFGPKLFTARRQGTTLSIHLIPFGAAVHAPEEFEERATWDQSLLVSSSGPLVNLTLGMLAFFTYLLLSGLSRDMALLDALSKAATGSILGILKILSLIPKTLGSFVHTAVLGHTEGAVGALNEIMVDAAADRWCLILIFAATNLAVASINLIPFPPLDGFHIIGALIRGITGYRVPDVVYRIGWIILIAGFCIGTAVATGQSHRTAVIWLATSCAIALMVRWVRPRARR